MSIVQTNRKARSKPAEAGMQPETSSTQSSGPKTAKPRSTGRSAKADADSGVAARARKRPASPLLSEPMDGEQPHLREQVDVGEQRVLQDDGLAHRDTEQWQRRVAEAAYYRAERRGFANGSAEQDWLEAEEELQRSRSEPRA